MATLTDLERADEWAKFMAAGHCPASLTKPELRAGIDATDNRVEANVASFNAALPQPFRGAATPEQKFAILTFVIQRRGRGAGVAGAGAGAGVE